MTDHIREYIGVASGHIHVLKEVLEGYKGYHYLIVNGRPVKLFQWDDSEELYIPSKDGAMMVYKEYLDGPLISVEEARELFPEEFI